MQIDQCHLFASVTSSISNRCILHTRSGTNSTDLYHPCSPIQVKRVPAWFKMTIQYKMLRSNLMVSEPSELNIVYAVVQRTGHHMGKSVTKTLHVITPLKRCLQKECFNKKFTSSVQRHLSYTCSINAMIRFDESLTIYSNNYPTTNRQ